MSKKTEIVLIVAACENNCIGKDNSLLWHLPTDFKRFKKLTTDHSIIMGRKTFESLPGILPKRRHIILTKNPNFTIPNCEIATNIEKALEKTANEEKVYIIGGAEIYKQYLSIADKIELTRVHTTFTGDAYFPKISLKNWELITSTKHLKDEKHLYDFSFLTYKKIMK